MVPLNQLIITHQVIHQKGDQWDLQISAVTFSDAGVYECQVSTSPKASLPITLNVLGEFFFLYDDFFP